MFINKQLVSRLSIIPRTFQIETLELEKTHLKVKLKERVPEIAAQVEDSLVDKYCYVEYTKIFNRNRTRALKVGKRPGHYVLRILETTLGGSIEFTFMRFLSCLLDGDISLRVNRLQESCAMIANSCNGTDNPNQG